MTAKEQARILTLAAEYVELVEMMRGGQYADTEEYRQLSGQRTLTHDELIALTGVTERSEMYAYCRKLLASSGSRNASPSAETRATFEGEG